MQLQKISTTSVGRLRKSNRAAVMNLNKKTLHWGWGLAVTLVSICSDQVKKPICFISHFSKIMEYIVFIMFIYKLILTRNKLTFNNPIVDNC